MISTNHSGHKSKLPKLYNNLVTEFSKKKWGYETVALLGQSCLGGVAVMVTLQNCNFKTIRLIELFLITVFCMSFNAAVLIDLDSKPAFNILIASVFVCLCIIAINLI